MRHGHCERKLVIWKFQVLLGVTLRLCCGPCVFWSFHLVKYDIFGNQTRIDVIRIVRKTLYSLQHPVKNRLTVNYRWRLIINVSYHVVLFSPLKNNPHSVANNTQLFIELSRSALVYYVDACVRLMGARKLKRCTRFVKPMISIVIFFTTFIPERYKSVY